MEEFYFEIAMAAVYLIGMPILVSCFYALHKYMFITRRAQRMRPIDAKTLPKPLSKQASQRLNFTLKQDTRPLFGKFSITYKWTFVLLWVLGLVITVAGAFIGIWQVTVAGLVWFFVAYGFSQSSAKKILTQREKLMDRIFKTVDFKMSYGKEGEERRNEVVNIVQWKDFLSPEKIKIEIPLRFNADAQEEFMRHFNQHLSKMSSEAEERAWVPADDMEKNTPGWDYGASTLTVRTVPPLPTRADWHEGYVLNDNCAWSFFPLGIGVEDGVQMPNPENPEEMMNIIGVDVSGEQQKLAKKKGFYTSSKVTTSPQMLVGGGTGGGKSLSINTLVPVLKKPFK